MSSEIKLHRALSALWHQEEAVRAGKAEAYVNEQRLNAGRAVHPCSNPGPLPLPIQKASTQSHDLQLVRHNCANTLSSPPSAQLQSTVELPLDLHSSTQGCTALLNLTRSLPSNIPMGGRCHQFHLVIYCAESSCLTAVSGSPCFTIDSPTRMAPQPAACTNATSSGVKIPDSPVISSPRWITCKGNPGDSGLGRGYALSCHLLR